MVDRERFEKLRALTPLAAVQAWIDGDFGIGDEPALIAAIRANPSVVLSDEELIDEMGQAMERGEPAARCLRRLSKSK